MDTVIDVLSGVGVDEMDAEEAADAIADRLQEEHDLEYVGTDEEEE
jgi:hypothetical protein